MKLEKKHYIGLLIIIVIIIIIIFWKPIYNFISGLGNKQVTRQYRAGGTAPSPSHSFTNRAIISQNIVPTSRVSCDGAVAQGGGKFCVNCYYGGITGNLYTVTACARSAGEAQAEAIAKANANLGIVPTL